MKAGKTVNKEKVIFFIVFAAAVILYFFSWADFPAVIIILLLIYILASVFIVCFTGKDLECTFSGSPQGGKNEPIHIEFCVNNRSVFPVLRCSICIEAENVLTGEKSIRSETAALSPKGKKKISFYIKSQYCGRIDVRFNYLIITDPLCVFKRMRLGTATTETYVMPVIGEIPLSREELSHYDMESYHYSSAKKGSDPSETFGLRSYMPGDNMKTIHWKLSGKLDDIIIRDLGLPVENSLMMILDKRPAGKGENAYRLADKTTELFVSLSHAAVGQGIRHSVGWYNCVKDSFMIRKVNCCDDIFKILPEILSGPCREDALSAPERFIESDADKNYASYIYVTTEDVDAQKETERLNQYGEVNIYRAGKDI